ncbi:MAG: rhodanese-like domain-containing protein [Actinobacteria bacterium]|nr:rhodanese-like domain-containing protein [Actinomycetota bacterium]
MGELREIDVQELARLTEAGTTVIDVREENEYDEGHVPGARFVPLSELEARADAVPADEPVMVICRSGARSAKACGILAALGRDVTNVAGGTMAWIDAGFAVNTGLEP